MKIFLESGKELINFSKSFKNVVFDNTEVVTNANALITVVDIYERRIDNLTNENNILSTNFVKGWIDFNIDVAYDNEENPKPKSEIKKDVIDSIKVELTNFKAEKDYNSIDWGNYNFIGMVLDYGVKFEDIVDKVEKDLAEIEAVPVNTVEEKAVELEGK